MLQQLYYFENCIYRNIPIINIYFFIDNAVYVFYKFLKFYIIVHAIIVVLIPKMYLYYDFLEKTKCRKCHKRTFPALSLFITMLD